MSATAYFYLLPVIPAGIMAFSDFRKRSVSLLWLTAFGMAVIGVSVYYNGIGTTIQNALFNAGLFVYLLAGGVAYWRVRHGKWLNPIDRTIGSGDILFILFLAFLFDLRTFLMLLLVSMVASLGWWGLRTAGSRKGLTIPLVGVTAIVVSLWMIKKSLGL